MAHSLRQFIEEVTPVGKEHLEFLLYAMRASDAPPLCPPDVSAWPAGAEVDSYWLRDDDWPVVVELFEIRSPMLPVENRGALSKALSVLTSQGATLSWYMLDGAFGGIDPLFTHWTSERTYGVCLPARTPELALTREARTTDAWKALLAEAETHVHRRHPEIKQRDLVPLQQA